MEQDPAGITLNENPPPQKTAPKKTALPKWLIPVALVACLVGGGLLVRALTAENPNLTAGKQHLATGSFDDAASAIRLALQEQPNNQEAKGLLLYAVTRQKLDEQTNAEDASIEDLYLGNFLQHFALFEIEKSLDLFSAGDYKKELEANIKEFKDSMRKSFTEDRIPLRDWDDYQESYLASARALYGLKINSDNKADLRAKDIAAAILAREGDQGAAQYLVERCAQDPNILPLTIVAGPIVEQILEREVSKESTFIEEEGAASLAYLKLRKPIMEFAESQGKFRIAKKSDLPKDQRDLIEDQFTPFRTSPPEVQLILVLAAKESENKFDPSTLSVQLTGPKETPMAVLSGYNAEKRRFITQGLVFANNEYKDLELSPSANGYLVTELPAGERVTWDEEKGQLRIGIERIQDVTKTRDEERIRPVVKFRQEERYDPYLNDGMGGYQVVSVPYTDYEPYRQSVDYKVPEEGALWVTYVFDSSAHTVKELRRLWVSDSSSYEETLAETESKTASTTTSRPSGGVNPERIDSMINRMLTESLSSADFSALNKGELRLVRNGVFARLGYMFKDQGLRGFFQSRSWYEPKYSDIAIIEQSLSPTQRENLDTIKSVENN